MGRRLILGLALLALVALSSGLSLGERDLAIGGLGAESNEIAPSPKPPAKQPTFKGALAKAKNLAKAVIEKGKQLIGAARAAVKKEIGIVKSYLKKKWNDVKQIYQYSRHCLNHKAPKKLRLKVPNSALCATVKKAHPLFVAALEKIVDKTPQPNLKQTIAAELAGERGLRHRQQRKRGRSTISASRASSLLETGAEIPGDPTMKWPSTLISYALSPDLDPAAVVNFQWGVNHIESLTCMRFQQVEFNVTGDGIQVLPSETKCAAIVGYQGSDGQQMWWGPDCAPGSGAHELLHALGFSHAQNRLDRDLYIKINMSLIEPGGEHNFEKKEPPFQNYGPYDFMSILHYPSTSFSITEDPVMTEILDRPASTPPALNSPWSGDAQRDSLTEGDVAAVTEIYCKA